jgi:hypothetical protein
MPETWRERIRRWLRLEPRVSGSFDPATFVRICEDDPEAARGALLLDHRELAEELALTHATYEEKLKSLAARTRDMPAADVRREVSSLRDAQDAIRRTLRRIDASSRSAQELLAELREWEARQDEDGPRHADHPDVRAEIVRSELRARGLQPDMRAIAMEESPFGRLGCVVQSTPVCAEEPSRTSDEFDEVEALPLPDPEHLVEAIRQATRDAEQWLSVTEPEQEAIEDLHQLRRLHALLKRLDREQGNTRDRLTLAVRMH